MTKITIVSRLNILLVLLLLAALVVFPLAVNDNYWLTVAITMLMYVTISSSWNILGGLGGQTNLGHAAFFGSGALVTRLLYLSGWNIFPSLIVGGLVAVAIALLIGIPAFRLRGVYFAIGTLALAQILYITVGNTFSTISSLAPADLSAYQLAPRYYLFLGLAVLTIGTAYVLLHSKWGLGIMAVREEEDAAESAGVSALKHKLLALALSAFFGGLAGGGFAFFQTSYYPQLTFGPEWTFDSMMMAYVGGVGTIGGPVIGSVFFVLLKEQLSKNLAQFNIIVFGVLFILVVLFIPGGFMSLWDRVQKRLQRGAKSSQPRLAPNP